MPALITTPLDLLLPHQRRWYADTSRFLCGVWSRQTGKDFTSGAVIAADCQQRPRTTWMIAAPSERQSMESLQKVKEWSQAFDLAIANEITEREAPGALMKSSAIEYANGSRVIAVPGRPDTVRGYSANVLLTEFAFFDDPDATWAAVFPSITNPLRGGEKRLLVISTPNGKTGRGKRFFQIVDENLLHPRPDLRQRWSVHKVTIADAVAGGMALDIETLRATLDDEEKWAQEFMCEFIDGSSVLLPYELISLAESHEATEACDPALFASGRELYCGVDFGRVSDPTVCITLERVGPLLITREVLVLRDTDTVRQQEILANRLAAARRTCFDFTGPGIGLGDHLAQQHGRYKPEAHEFGRIELFTFSATSKRLLFPRLRKAFEAPTTLRIPPSVDLREDLHAMQQVIRNGEYTYSAPRTADGHSDRCTALALAVRAAGDGAESNFVPRALGRAATINAARRRRSAA